MTAKLKRISALFSGTTPKSIPATDFLDLATGVGYKTLYCGDTSDSFGVFSFTNASYSGSFGIVQNQTAVLTFTSLIEKPFVVSGLATIEIPISYSAKNSAQNTDSYVSGSILVNRDGSDNTFFEQYDVRQMSNVATTQNEFRFITLDQNINRLRLKKGDTLKIRIEGLTQISTNASITIGFDPAGRTDKDVVHSAPASGFTQTDWLIAPTLKVNLPIATDNV